jgi:putative two-component system response regulator
MALTDVYDALTTKRCYKDIFSHEESKQILLDGRGRHFDPKVVDAFLRLEASFVEIKNKFKDKHND